jgi:hypothetical protein
MKEAQQEKEQRWADQMQLLVRLQSTVVGETKRRRQSESRGFLRRTSGSGGGVVPILARDFPLFATPSVRIPWALSEEERRAMSKYFDTHATREEKGAAPVVNGQRPTVKKFFLQSNLSELVRPTSAAPPPSGLSLTRARSRLLLPRPSSSSLCRSLSRFPAPRYRFSATRGTSQTSTKTIG